ncbi:unnamed protein product [Symbiodinium sp. CCMP2456]|nr:unnamed protein product [Symbiodinium sp. CCMP2456]
MAHSFARFRKPALTEGEDEKKTSTAARSFKTLEVDGRKVTLRVFTPAGEGGSKPAVVMVCGLLWFGEGILGFIGLNFNDAFGHALARHGLACVQIHTPQRHIAQTRVQELALALCAPVYLVPGLRFLLLAADVLMLLTSRRDVWLMLVAVVLPGLVDAVLAASLAVPMLLMGPLGWLFTALFMIGGLVLVPALHFAFRMGQYLMGELDLTGEGRRDYLKEVEAAVSWAEENASALKSDGRLVLCGYSSGGHVAALYGLETCVAAKDGRARSRFEAVVLVSGIYDLRTKWEDMRRFLAPAMNLIFKDILGADTEARRAAASPAAVVQSPQQKALDSNCTWWILNARTELLGLPLLEDILFASAGFADGLKAKGAPVRRAQCGHNHWLLIFGFPAFAASFSATLKGTEGEEEAEKVAE